MVVNDTQAPVLGRYHIISQNTAGAFGTVLIAWDPKLQRRVAIKRIPLLSERELTKMEKAATTLLPSGHNTVHHSISERIKTTLLPTNKAPQSPAQTDQDIHTTDQGTSTSDTLHTLNHPHKNNKGDEDLRSRVAHTNWELDLIDKQQDEEQRAYHAREAARQAAIGQEQAFKDEARRIQEAALREARTAGMLSHPNIVLMHDFDVEDDFAYLIMEYIDGITLADLLDYAGQLNADVVAHIAQSIGNALSFAHENGVLHLDIKPENILIDRSGTIKIADFGMANLMSATGYENARGGTVGYMPLEQIDLEELTEASDIFSFAAVIYECLSDIAPFMAANAQESRELLLQGAPDILEKSGEAHEQTAELLEQALSSFVAFRPVDAKSFGLALAKSLGSAKRGQATLVKDLEDILEEVDEQTRLEEEMEQAEEMLAHRSYLPGCFIYEHPFVGKIVVKSLRFLCIFMAVWALMQPLGLEPRSYLGALVALILGLVGIAAPTLVLGLICICTPLLIGAGGIVGAFYHSNDQTLLFALIAATILMLTNIALWLSTHLVRTSIVSLLCSPALLMPGVIALMCTELASATSSISGDATVYTFTVSVSALGTLAILYGLWLPRLAAVICCISSVMYGQIFWTCAHSCAPSSLLAGFGGAPTDIFAFTHALMQACSVPSFYIMLVAAPILTLSVAFIMPFIRRHMWGFEHVMAYAQLHDVPITQLGVLVRPTYPSDLMKGFQLYAEEQNDQRSLDEYEHGHIDTSQLSLEQAEELAIMHECESATNKRCWALILIAWLGLGIAQSLHIMQVLPREALLNSGNTTGFVINAWASVALCFILLIIVFTLFGRSLPVPSRSELRTFLQASHQ